MGQFLLFFAGLLLTMLTGIFGNWAVSSWYYHQSNPTLPQGAKFVPIIAFGLIFIVTFVVFVYLANTVPQL